MQTATEDPAAYSRYCGPQSLASVLELTPGTTARVLLDVMRHRGCIEAPATSAETMMLALYVLHVGVESYNIETGRSAQSNEECIARARDTSPISPVDKSALSELFAEIIDAAPESSRAGMLEHVRQMYATSLRLCDWMLFAGTWLLDVDTPTEAHWVALRDGAVLVSRDSTFWNCRIRKALRLRT